MANLRFHPHVYRFFHDFCENVLFVVLTASLGSLYWPGKSSNQVTKQKLDGFNALESKGASPCRRLSKYEKKKIGMIVNDSCECVRLNWVLPLMLVSFGTRNVIENIPKYTLKADWCCFCGVSKSVRKLAFLITLPYKTNYWIPRRQPYPIWTKKFI